MGAEIPGSMVLPDPNKEPVQHECPPDIAPDEPPGWPNKHWSRVEGPPKTDGIWASWGDDNEALVVADSEASVKQTGGSWASPAGWHTRRATRLGLMPSAPGGQTILFVGRLFAQQRCNMYKPKSLCIALVFSPQPPTPKQPPHTSSPIRLRKLHADQLQRHSPFQPVPTRWVVLQ